MIGFLIGLVLGYVIGRTWLIVKPKAIAWWNENKSRGGAG